MILSIEYYIDNWFSNWYQLLSAILLVSISVSLENPTNIVTCTLIIIICMTEGV